MKEVFIVAAKRTPLGGFMGSLSHFTAPQLGAIAIKNAYSSINFNPQNIDAVYFGNVLSAGIGQAPARQAAKLADIPNEVDSTTINKVCSSGLKATVIGAQQIQLGLQQVVVTGGMESMSNVPHYSVLRQPVKLGDKTFVDGLLKDGLTDAYNHKHMGTAAELCATTYNISRRQQDEYALQSYERAAKAWKQGNFTNEVVPVHNNTLTITEDEDIYKIIPDKVARLKPAFVEGGTVTAANASNLNDGAAALVLASSEAVSRYGLHPIARIISYADASQAPEWFTTSPSIAIKHALQAARLQLKDIDFFEINEAYAAVALANQQILGLSSNNVNIYGGAVAMGHPLGASGARILCTLLSVLTQNGGKYGVAGICNGGGGASAIIIENLKN